MVREMDSTKILFKRHEHLFEALIPSQRESIRRCIGHLLFEGLRCWRSHRRVPKEKFINSFQRNVALFYLEYHGTPSCTACCATMTSGLLVRFHRKSKRKLD